MALSTLKGIELGDFITVDHDTNTISFKIQNGAIKENGLNGCQVDNMIETAKIIIEGLNKNFPSDFNTFAIEGLDKSLIALKERKKDREHRGVEGFEKK
ncbi:MAG: hypothetical protein DRQ46_00440 [Gammaproteobacteria bacterium]|nr:MAG: hypothetical protein DRQ46_00440 [Gammaproteobacteria bacterium]